MLARLRDHNDALSSLWQRKLRWVKAVKLHTTWFFLGDVDASRVPEVTAVLAEISRGRQSGEIVYDKIDFWPTARKSRLLALTSSMVPAHLAQLAADIRHGLRAFASKPDDRDFRPHITLMRFELLPGADHKRPLEFPDWLNLNEFIPLVHKLDQVALIESHMGAGRDDYETLQSFPLVLT